MNNYTRYYDRDNSQNSLSARQNCVFGHQPPFGVSPNTSTEPTEPPEEEKKEETLKDEKNRRIISRESLFEDPDFFYSDGTGDGTQSNSNTGYPWTQGAWLRAGEGTGAEERGSSRLRGNKLQKKLSAALSQPVQMGKAANMMEKMGWQGGALGRTGDGIVEPIAPNAAYAMRTRGFGQAVVQPPPKKRERPKNQEYNLEHFNTNTLLQILEFVRNDKEIEVLFDSQLFKNERKIVHGLVNDVINNSDMIDMAFDNITQMDIVEDIHKYNRHVLCTLSEGVHPNRKLCLYKEAPNHVYLITPDDLSDEPLEETAVDITNDQGDSSEGESKPKPNRRKRHCSDAKNDHKADSESKTEEKVEEEENPFLRSITRNLKMAEEVKAQSETTSIKEEKDTIDKIVDFFVEFVDHDDYTEFRFLGEFQQEEINSINTFLTNVFNCINIKCQDKKYDKVVKCISNEKLLFEMREDCNGGPVIYKFQKQDQKSTEDT